MLHTILFYIIISLNVIGAIGLLSVSYLAIKFYSLKKRQWSLMKRYNKLGFEELNNELDILREYASQNNLFNYPYIELSKSIKHINDGIRNEVYASIKSLSKMIMKNNFNDVNVVLEDTEKNLNILEVELEMVPKKIYEITQVYKNNNKIHWELNLLFNRLVSISQRESIIFNYKNQHIERFIRTIDNLFVRYAEAFEIVNLESIEIVLRLIKHHLKELLNAIRLVPVITLLTRTIIPQKEKDLNDKSAKIPFIIRQKMEINEIRKDVQEIDNQIDNLLSQFKWKPTRLYLLSYANHLDSASQLMDLEIEANKYVKEETSNQIKKAYLSLRILKLLREEIKETINTNTLSPEEVRIKDTITIISKRIISMHQYLSSQKRKPELPSKEFKLIADLAGDIQEFKQQVKELSKSLDSKTGDRKNLLDEMQSTKVFLLELEVLIRRFEDDVIVERHLPVVNGIKKQISVLEKEAKISSKIEKLIQELDIIKEDAYSIWEDITTTSQAKYLTEKALMFINRYRYEDEEIKLIVSSAEIDYYNHDYENALSLLVPAIERIKHSIERSKIQSYRR